MHSGKGFLTGAKAWMRSVVPASLLLAGALAAIQPVTHAADEVSRAAPLPVPSSLVFNAMGNLLNWNRMPDGVNPADCKPAPGQYPVLLVHGTFANAMLAYSALGPVLHNAGLCVYTYNYGAWQPGDLIHGLAPMEESAQRLAQEVAQVMARNGADKVNLVGHSQGGTLIHYYAKVLEGARNVHTLVAVAPSLRGTERVDPEARYTYCVACGQQSPQSQVIRRLNDGPIAQAGNRNFVLATRNDWVVKPVESQFIREPGVTNVMLQDLFPGRWATHSGILYDADALALIRSWLE